MRPPVGAVVVVTARPDPARHWLGADGAATRVEDDREGALALLAPRGPGDVEAPGVGDVLHLSWTGPRGVHEALVRVAARPRGGGEPGSSRVALWWVEPAGDAVVTQRRDHVRAAQAEGLPVHVQLTWLLPEEGSAEGFLCDLSEGGLRAEVRGWPGGGGVPVVVRLTAAEPTADGVAVHEHELLATAVRDAPVPGGAGAAEVSVRFHDPVPRADELRSLVFAWERAVRRAGRAAGR